MTDARTRFLDLRDHFNSVKRIEKHERQERHQNPNTRTRWAFPKDAKRYLALVLMRAGSYAGAPECENGHFGCAAWADGPCADRIESSYLNQETP